jgi:hypothetical protein
VGAAAIDASGELSAFFFAHAAVARAKSATNNVPVTWERTARSDCSAPQSLHRGVQALIENLRDRVGMTSALRWWMDRHHLSSIVVLLVVFAGCASTPPAKDPEAPIPKITSATMTSTVIPTPPESEIIASTQTTCDLVCERAHIVPRPVDNPDYTEQATANANAVLEAMHDDLLACYKKRVRVNPQAHGFITVDIIINAQGRVQNIETTGGAILGDATMGCLVKRIRLGTFDPPHDGGTLRIHVPFSLRRVSPGEETF